MGGFYLSWAVSALLILLLAAWAGKKTGFAALNGRARVTGILIDERERYSLNRLQIVMWTFLILSTFLGLLFANLASDPGKALAIPAPLLGLMGISAGSGTVAGAVKDHKNCVRPDKIIGGKGFLPTLRSSGVAAAQNPTFAQVILEEEGTLGQDKIVSVTKFQNFVFTMALGVVYVVLAVKARGYPVLDQEVLWLIGISHAGYIGGKLPDKN